VNKAPTKSKALTLLELLTRRRPLIHHLFTNLAQERFILSWAKFGRKHPKSDETIALALRNPDVFSPAGLGCLYACAAAREGMTDAGIKAEIERVCKK